MLMLPFTTAALVAAIVCLGRLHRLMLFEPASEQSVTLCTHSLLENEGTPTCVGTVYGSPLCPLSTRTGAAAESCVLVNATLLDVRKHKSGQH